MYADFTYYTDRFHGKKIPDSDSFLSVLAGAQAALERLTFGRLTESTPGAADALCAVCEVFYTRSHREGIQSESVDGYSVTYCEEGLSRSLRKTIRLYLPPELLYRGC
ncbi:MAG: hypothetical protein E7399_03020 [Ruminococcaceae bacterium]|nr:hypothetical protein [Oscillospiraceae bacterium]